MDVCVDQWTTEKDDSFIRNLFEVNSCADSGVDEDGCSLYREDKDGCSLYREDKNGCSLYREDKDGDLIEELAAKEKDLLLAAELGKMLLEENQALQMALRRVTEECEKHVEEHERAEHELRRNLENVAAVYDARLSDVNAELRQVREGREELRRTSATYQRQTTTSINELREDNERLAGQLKEAARQRALLMAEVRQLRDVSTVKRHVTRDNTRQVDLLKEEVQLLTDRNREVNKRVAILTEENTDLISDLEIHQDRVFLLEKLTREQASQLQSRDRQLEEVYDSNSQLQERVNSMFLQLSTSRLDKCPSLYSELQSSQPSSQPGKLKQQTMADDNNIAFAQAPDSTNSFAVGSRRLSTSASHPSFPSSFSYQADIEDGADDEFQMHISESPPPLNCHGILQFRDDVQENYELKQEVLEAYNRIRQLCRYLQQSNHRCQDDNGIDDGWASDSGEWHVQSGKLRGVTKELESLVDNAFKEYVMNKQEEQEIQDELLGTAEKRVSLKSQIKLMREELIEGNKRTHEMKMKVDLLEKDLKKKNEELSILTQRLTRQHKEIAELQAERDKLQDIAANESSELAIDEVLKQTRQERRDVTKRHNDLELELTNVRLETSKLDMQLMEAIQQKVAMSVQVEAWESDMQTVLESQMKMRIQEADSCAGSSSVDDVIITQATTPSGSKNILRLFRRS